MADKTSKAITLLVRDIRKALQDAKRDEAKQLLEEIKDLKPRHEVTIAAKRWERCLDKLPPLPKEDEGATKPKKAPHQTPPA